MIFSNTCVGARVYELLGKQFDNPFVWSLVMCDDIFTLLENWSNINFSNYQLLEPSTENNMTYCVRVDNLFTIRYPHYKKDSNCLTPTRTLEGVNGLDVRYCNIEDYIVEKYVNRVARMTKTGLTFLIVQSDKTRVDTFDKLLLIQHKLIEKNHNSIIVCNCEELKKYETVNNRVVVYKENLFTANTKKVAKDIIEELNIKEI